MSEDNLISKDAYPLVSAILLTGNNLEPDIIAAIACFKNQKYPNKELIIVNNAKTQLLASGLNINAGDNVFIIDTPYHLSAGMARNYGINAAKGQILAQFDCDYWHHPDRLNDQVAVMANNESHICLLSHSLKYSFNSGGASYFKNNKNILPSTMIFVRPEKIDYPNTDKYEECRMLQKMIQAEFKPIVLNSPKLCCKLFFNNKKRDIKAINIGTSKEEFKSITSLIEGYKI